MICLLAICGLLGIFGVMSDEVKGESWEIETVDSRGDVGESTSLALDSNDYPHISYYDRTNTALKYAKWTGSEWNIGTVDSEGDVGQYTSIALDANDHAHISYYDVTNQDLKYANWNGNEWIIETVDSGGEVGGYSSIAVDDNGHVHISYYNGTVDLVRMVDALKYAHWDGNSWNIETIDYAADVGRFTSIALDMNGNAHISYIDCNSSFLKYTRWTGSEWDITTITTVNRQQETIQDYGSGTSLALDSDDYPHIVFVDGGFEILKYAKWDGSFWTIENVSFVKQVYLHVSIALDSSNYPHITYFTRNDNTINYARWNGTDWNIVYVDDKAGNTEGGFNSLALDKNDFAHISYFDYNYDDLKYAKLIPSNESLETVVLDEGNIFIHWPELTIGRYETIYIQEVERITPDDNNLTMTVVNSNLNIMETSEPEYERVTDGYPLSEAVLVELYGPEYNVTEYDDYEIQGSNEVETPEIIDEIYNSNGAEQPDKYSNLQENEVSNNAFLWYFLIIAGLNLIIIVILIVILMLVYVRTIPKSQRAPPF